MSSATAVGIERRRYLQLHADLEVFEWSFIYSSNMHLRRSLGCAFPRCGCADGQLG